METYREELEIPTWQWLELLQDSMSVAVIKCRKVAVKKCMFMAVRNDI